MGKTKSRANGDGDVFPRKNKAGKITSYRGAYIGPDGKRRYVSGKNKEEARKALREARANSDKGLLFDADNLKVGEYLDRWLSDSVRDTVKATTFERYEQITRLHLKPALGRMKLKALTPANVRGLYREKLEAGSSARTVRYIHTTLHKALKQAVMDGLIPRNATEAVKPPQPSREEMRPLTPEQAKHLLQAAHEAGDRLEALYVLAIHRPTPGRATRFEVGRRGPQRRLPPGPPDAYHNQGCVRSYIPEDTRLQAKRKAQQQGHSGPQVPPRAPAC